MASELEAGLPSRSAEPLADSPFQEQDEAGVSRKQLRIALVAGMGFFTDAYDLFVIGIVVALLGTQWHLSTTQTSLLNSATLAASAVGALVFGRIADLLGRTRIYGVEVLILAVGAIASAFAPNFTFLLVCRIVLGIGIGGDYPVSATIMSEYSGRRNRGKMVGLVFAMQGAGLIVGPLVASAFLACGASSNVTWRVLLAIGAIPGLAVYVQRRKLRETPRFAAAAEEASSSPAEARPSQRALDGFSTILRNRRLLTWLIGTATCWMLLDFSYYGNSISSPEILKLVDPGGSLLSNTLIQLAIFAGFAVPGYLVAIFLLDRIGRRSIQMLGFSVMGLCFLLIGLVPSVASTATTFLLLYGISYFFTEFGPNTTTFIYPAELFPVEVRTTGHGISAAAGKMGAFAGAYLFPTMLASSMGLRGAEVVAGLVSIVGLGLTTALLPETKGRTLEEISAEAATEAPPVPALSASIS